MSNSVVPDGVPLQTDEIDLWALIETLWVGKLVILSFVALFTLLAFSYMLVIPKSNSIFFPYKINFATVQIHQQCGQNENCIALKVTGLASEFIGSGRFNTKKSSLVYKGTNLEISQPLIDSVNAAATHVTQSIFTNTKLEVNMIEKELPTAIQSSETAAVNLINGKRIISSIEVQKQKAIDFGTPLVVLNGPKSHFIYTIMLLLGGIVGIFVVLIRQAIRNRYHS